MTRRVKPPPTGSLPKAGKEQHAAIYESAKARLVKAGVSEKAAKGRASRQAWCQVKRSWWQDKGGKWHKRKRALHSGEYPPGCKPYRGKKPRRSRNPQDDREAWVIDTAAVTGLSPREVSELADVDDTIQFSMYGDFWDPHDTIVGYLRAREDDPDAPHETPAQVLQEIRDRVVNVPSHIGADPSRVEVDRGKVLRQIDLSISKLQRAPTRVRNLAQIDWQGTYAESKVHSGVIYEASPIALYVEIEGELFRRYDADSLAEAKTIAEEIEDDRGWLERQLDEYEVPISEEYPLGPYDNPPATTQAGCVMARHAWDRSTAACGEGAPTPTEAARQLATARWTSPARERWVMARLLRGTTT